MDLMKLAREIGQVNIAAIAREKEVRSSIEIAFAEVAIFKTTCRISLASLAWSMAIDSFPTGEMPPGREGWVINCLNSRIRPFLKEAIEGDKLVIRDEVLGIPQNSEVRQRGELPLDAVVLKADLLTWCRTCGHMFKWLPLADEERQGDPKKGKHQQKQLAQERVILERIKEIGFDPLMIPKFQYTTPGVKSDVMKYLLLHRKDLFGTEGVFEKAWYRLRKNDEIIDAEEVSPFGSPPKKGEGG